MTNTGDPVVDLHQALIYLVRALVSQPEKTSVISTIEETETVLRITVAAEDVGKVIGKSGRTIGAIRTLAHATSQAVNRRIRVDVERPL